ncbi:Uncharacterised protein [Achromobacter sp. 2789STDY5608633]|uniref:Uncharacterized protein n=1 Tax=Achromobacter insuavis TaxID=1287735 RepID=A0A6J4ZLU0_9BURK|nr:hypothetical protein LMG26845_01705 [Achromobacter insuavis]CUI66687.1 Uncharacterised protein [Achromobacter sp. 2789STDY5608628]CUI79539.1 Uncharacterised protein [Achromobacter sp. 2789STDY5608633]
MPQAIEVNDVITPECVRKDIFQRLDLFAQFGIEVVCFGLPIKKVLRLQRLFGFAVFPGLLRGQSSLIAMTLRRIPAFLALDLSGIRKLHPGSAITLSLGRSGRTRRCSDKCSETATACHAAPKIF